MMTRKEAVRLVDPFVAGELPEAERIAFEAYLQSDDVLAAEVRVAKRIESSMFSQQWLSPSSDFTRAVLARIGLQPAFEPVAEPISKRELILEWIHGLAPAAAIIAFVAMFGQSLLGKMMTSLTWTASLLDSAIGTHIFSSYPAILMGLASLPIGILIISATVTRRLRLAS